MDSENREQLARRQRQLIDALTREEVQVDGFDYVQVRNMRQALLRKRMRGVERSWPKLAEGLGDGYKKAFGEFAHAHFLHPGQSHGEDAFCFGVWLEQKGLLPEIAQIEFVNQLMLREGGWIRHVWLAEESRFVVIVRLARRKFIAIRMFKRDR